MSNPANFNFQMNQARFVGNSAALNSNIVRPIAMTSAGMILGFSQITSAAGLITDAVYPIGINSTKAYAANCMIHWHNVTGTAVTTINAYINQGTLSAPSFAVLSAV